MSAINEVILFCIKHPEIRGHKALAELLSEANKEVFILNEDNALFKNRNTELRIEIEQLKEAVEEAEKFHPRAMKLIRKKKNFLVVAEDEPYFIDVYATICANEREKNRWSQIDEDNYQDALQRRLRKLSANPEEK